MCGRPGNKTSVSSFYLPGRSVGETVGVGFGSIVGVGIGSSGSGVGTRVGVGVGSGVTVRTGVGAATIVPFGSADKLFVQADSSSPEAVNAAVAINRLIFLSINTSFISAFTIIV